LLNWLAFPRQAIKLPMSHNFQSWSTPAHHLDVLVRPGPLAANLFSLVIDQTFVKIISQFGNSILLSFPVVVKGFGLFRFRPFPRCFLSEAALFCCYQFCRFRLDRAALLLATGAIIHLGVCLSRESITNSQNWSVYVRHLPRILGNFSQFASVLP